MKKKVLSKGYFITRCASIVVILVLTIVINSVATYWDIPLTQFIGTVGGKSAEEESGSGNIFYEKGYDSLESVQKAETSVAQQIVAEGAVLLKNDNNKLPLAAGSKISIFGSASVNILTGGTGSGSTSTDEVFTLKDALTEKGIEVNSTLWDFYDTGAGKDYRNGIGANTVGLSSSSNWTLAEAPQSAFTSEVENSYSDYSDAAIVVFSRNNGEGYDLPRNMASDGGSAEEHYLELTSTEKELLLAVNEAGFTDIIVLVNSASAMELGFLDEEEYNIESCLQFGGIGADGMSSIAGILSGEINPSGRTVDTYAYDALSSPAAQNFGDFKYSAGSEYYVTEAEGIYVGYRYYETRYEDKVMSAEGVGEYDYSTMVQFPLGYGLSYTSFEWSDYTMSENNGEFTVNVTVANNGSIAGKDTVEVYYQSPYTDYDKENKVEKSSVSLVGFTKTDVIEPGESQTVEITFSLADMVSYDYTNAKTYILDAGTYYITAAANAHEAVNNILSSKSYTVENGMDKDGDVAMVSSYEQTELDTNTYAVTENGTAISNLFDAADITSENSPAYDAEFEYLSRSNWEGTFPVPYGELSTKTSTNASGYQYEKEVDSDFIALVQATEFEASGNPTELNSYSMPTLDAENGLEAIDLVGESYDSELWDQLLDQLSLGEMKVLVGKCGYSTPAVASINMAATKEVDGPAGLNSFIGNDVKGYSWPSEVVLATTWNDELAYEMGVLVGEEALFFETTGWYAPAMNTHRTPFGGRNFEYYSEDGFLAGVLAEQEVAGAQSKGLVVYIKHFALNEQDTHREGICTWNNEQAMRELYFMPFQKCIESYGSTGPMAIMSSYNRIGVTWTGGSYNLITGLVRNEWNFDGMILTDYGAGAYMDADMMIAAGADAVLATGLQELTDSSSAAGVSLMRQASKNTLYTIVNSNAMNGVVKGAKVEAALPIYKIILFAIDGLAVLAIGLLIWRMIRRIRRSKTIITIESEDSIDNQNN